MNLPEQHAKLPFYYVMVVWGEKYVGMLLDVAIPSFLAPRNLPALTNLCESRFLFITTAADRERIEKSLIFQKLQSFIEPEFVICDWIDGDMPYHLKAAKGHQLAAEITRKNKGYCVYLCPDCIISNGSFAFLEHIARLGKRAVMTPGLRLITESVFDDLAARNLLKNGAPICMSGRELVSFGMRHLHIEVQRYNWDHPNFAMYPHMCTWNVSGDGGLLIRAFHLHPIMIDMGGAKDFGTLHESTIDGDFLGNNISDWEQIHVETDSDNLLIFSLTDRDDRYTPLEPNSPDISKIRNMAYSQVVNPLHRLFFTKAIKLHAGPLNSKWADREQETAAMVYPILSLGRETMKQQLSNVPLRDLANELGIRVRRRARRAVQRFFPQR